MSVRSTGVTASRDGSCRRIACLELAQTPSRLDAELVDENAPRVLIRLQCVGLATTAVESQHQLAPKALTKWVVGDEPLELGDHLGFPAERELLVGELLGRREPQLLQPSSLRLGERGLADVCERGTAPQRKRLTQLRRSIGRRGFPCFGDQPLDAEKVEIVGLHDKLVAAGQRSDHLASEHTTKLRHVHLQRLGCRRRRPLPPQPVDEHRLRNRLVGVQEQQCEQRAVLGPP